MTRIPAASLFVLALVCGAAATTAADDAGWDECFRAPTRACVLREAVAAALADPFPRVSTLSRIAEAQSKAGLSADAAATIDDAVQAEKLFTDRRIIDRDFQEIMPLLVSAGQLAHALEVAGAIKDPYWRAEALGDIAVAEGQTSGLDAALRRTRPAPRPGVDRRRAGQGRPHGRCYDDLQGGFEDRACAPVHQHACLGAARDCRENAGLRITATIIESRVMPRESGTSSNLGLRFGRAQCP
jgi:hypothetical protein